MDNLFVEFRAGRPRTCKTPQDLRKKFLDYLEDRRGRPLEEIETDNVIYKGENSQFREHRKDHPQLLSIADFCIYMGRNRCWWNELPEEFSIVKKDISDYLETYQLKGATAGVFNANIISRLLGLADKKEIVADGIQVIVNNKEEKGKIDNIGGLGI